MVKKLEVTRPDFGYSISYRNVKYPRLEYKTGALLLILPKESENEKDILEKHEKWIQRKELAIEKALEEAETKVLDTNRTEKELRNLVRSITEQTQAELNTRINKIYFRKMRTKWGSYSSKRNLTINTLLKYLPEDLIEYVIFHEMTHSLEKRHNERFWKIISKKYEDHQAKEKNLLAYWFLLQKTEL
jgi:hypothetical protein